jgi:hypothetical protein
VAFSVAGAPLAQASGADVERARQETTAQQRATATDKKAESAAGIGETDGEEHQTNDRDADGRRIWELEEAARKKVQAAEAGDAVRLSRDATGQSGNQLDLSV